MNRLCRPLVLRLSAMLGPVVVAGCTGMTQPEDIVVAEELCAKRGGFTHVSRFERGKNLVINCKDGAHIDFRRPDGA